MGIVLYSCLLTIALLLSSPWWLWRMLTSGRYRAGLRGRLGGVPETLSRAVQGHDTIWLHAVSVGEVLAAERLIAELQAALPDYVIAVSTTTATGQKLAIERLPHSPVFYMPLDFAFTMRRYLAAIRPRLVVLMESELWPRMLTECERGQIPVVVANARISDRSFPRYLRLRPLWKPLLAKVTLFLAQGDESAGRLVKMGVALGRIRVVGNLKYDAPPPANTEIVQTLRRNLPPADEIIVCGSTLEGEEVDILEAWVRLMSTGHRGVLILAPRHPSRFASVLRLVGKAAVRATDWLKNPRPLELGEVMVLDTLGHLAAVYQLATVAFIGGSLVPKGGHNPLEAARFGVPVVMGCSYENFREIVDGMRARDAIYLVEHGNLTLAFHSAMTRGRAVGRRGQEFFETQTGATARTVLALTDLVLADQFPTVRLR
jgi:3-deoxy-D-manno-octulosonic-acid transferase